jgi:hypothetical protein
MTRHPVPLIPATSPGGRAPSSIAGLSTGTESAAATAKHSVAAARRVCLGLQRPEYAWRSTARDLALG